MDQMDSMELDPQIPEPDNASPGYYVPAEDTSTWTPYQHSFLLKPTQDLSPRTEKENSRVFNQFNSKVNNSAVSSEIFGQSRKRNASSLQITNDTDVHKRLRSEICGRNEQVISTFNEDGCISPDTSMDISGTSNQISLDSSRFTSFNTEVPNTEESTSSSEISLLFEYISSSSDRRSGSYEQNHAMDFVDDMRVLPGPSRPRRSISQSPLLHLYLPYNTKMDSYEDSSP